MKNLARQAGDWVSNLVKGAEQAKGCDVDLSEFQVDVDIAQEWVDST
jgi:hypothetical protein